MYAFYLSVDCPGSMFVLILSNNHTTTIYTSKSQAEHRITRAGYTSNSSLRVSKLIFLCISAGPSGIIHVLHERVAMDVHYETLILQSFVFSFFFILRGYNLNNYPRESLSLPYKTRTINRIRIKTCNNNKKYTYTH